MTNRRNVTWKKVYTKNAPEAIGPYSQAVKAGGLLFTSGQIPLIPETGELAQGDIAVQAEQSCKNVAAILEAAGCKLTDVVKTTCFLADMADFPRFNEVIRQVFHRKAQARSAVAVKNPAQERPVRGGGHRRGQVSGEKTALCRGTGLFFAVGVTPDRPAQRGLRPAPPGRGDGCVVVVDIDEGIAVVAHAQLLHIAQLAQSVAGLHPLHQVVAVLRLQGVDQVHRRLVGGQDVQGGHDADVGGDHGMASKPSQSQETDMFRSTLI